MRTKQTERETKYIKVKTWDSMLSRWLLRFWFPVGQAQQHQEEEEWIKNEKSEVFYSVYRRTICEFNVGWLIFHSHSSLVLAIQHDLNHSIENWREKKKSTRNTFAWFKFRHVEKGQKTHSFPIKIMNVCRLLPLLLQISFNVHLSIEDSSNWIGLIPLIVSNLNKLTHNESVYLFSNAIETDKSTISNEPNEKRKTINGFH